MERGAATRGKVAQSIAGAAAIEIKATIPDHQIDGALAHFGLTTRNDEERYIYFFDTPALELRGPVLSLVPAELSATITTVR